MPAVRDFTLKSYDSLLDALIESDYHFCIFEEVHKCNMERFVILRHDVDRKPVRAVRMAEIEKRRNIRASYHIRVFPGRETELKEIVEPLISYGHEIAYHYEDLSVTYRERKSSGNLRAVPISDNELLENAGTRFKKNIDCLRRYYPVKVASMHGDPSSAVDNRKLWDYFDCHDFGVTCEPYLHIDYEKVLYLTDTGRRWDAGRSNIRDRVAALWPSDAPPPPERFPASTREVINIIRSGRSPHKMIINTHPQRWNDGILPWATELFWQNIKNIIKTVYYLKSRSG